MAGLPGSRAWVWVGPPLSASAVSRIDVRAVGWVPSLVAVISVAPGVTPLRAWAVVLLLSPRRL